jgi:hypothetical protein
VSTPYDWTGQYILEVATSPTIDSSSIVFVEELYTPSGIAPRTKVFNAANGEFFDYDTTYYWRVRQRLSNVEYDPSAIASFRTPRGSVLPHIRWDRPSGTLPAVNYILNISTTNPPPNGSTPNGTTIIATGIPSTAGHDELYFKLPDTAILRYNTTYYYRLTLTNGSSTVSTIVYEYTTKPLNIISEKFFHNSAEIDRFSEITFNIDADTIIYEVVTDEFEDLLAANFNANLTAISSVSHPNRERFRPIWTQTVDAPNSRSTFETELDTKAWTWNFATFTNPPANTTLTSNPNVAEILVTSNETITMQFEYGNQIVFYSVGEADAIDEMIIYTEHTFTNELDTMHHNNGMWIKLLHSTPSATPGTSIRVNLYVYETDTTITEYAYAEADEYKVAFTANAIRAAAASLTPANIPVRLSISPEGYPELARDIIWIRTLTPPAESGDAFFTVSEVSLDQTLEMEGSLYIRIVSTLDSIGFIYNVAQSNANPIRLGLATDPANFTIEAGFDLPAPSFVYAVPFDWDGVPPVNAGRVVEIIRQDYAGFALDAPANLTTNADIYPRFVWLPGFDPEINRNRGINEMTHYLLRINTSTSFIPDTLINPNLREFRTTDTVFYLPEDLNFNTTYFWRVDIVPGGPGSIPSNLGPTGAWTFSTINSENYIITDPISSNRTLAPGTYRFGATPIVESGATLTIPDGTTVIFQPGTTFFVHGNLVVGDTLRVLGVDFETTAGNTWGGIQFTSSNNNLVVDEHHNWVSGPRLKDLTITNALRPISSPAGVQYDIYIQDCFFENNHSGIRLSDASYMVGTSIREFDAINGTFIDQGSPVVAGGFYFRGNTIDGDLDHLDIDGLLKLPSTGISTANPSAIFIGNEIKNLAGNGIVMTGTPNANRPLIMENIITGTGNGATSIAIQAIPGANVINNQIGSATPADRNTGFGIINGWFIAENTITEGGAGAIFADIGATVIDNTITDNSGYGIMRGAAISGNNILSGAFSPFGRTTNAITADIDAIVSNNIITNPDGYAIRGGEIIFNNTITWAATITPAFTAATVNTHFAIEATVGARVEANTITRPFGFAIRNGMEILSNTITAGPNNLEGAFGIFADPYAGEDFRQGAEVSDNKIFGMKGIGITNGSLIQNNDVMSCYSAILSDLHAHILNNKLINNSTNIGFAIHNGSVIIGNEIAGFITAVNGTTRNSANDLISSSVMTQFQRNDVYDNIALNGNIFYVVKEASVTTPLLFALNIFENNRYSRDHVRIVSNGLTIRGNELLNDFDPDAWDPTAPTSIGGLIDIDNYAPGKGVAMYITLRDAITSMETTKITGFKGAFDGAGLYIDSVNNAIGNTIVIENQNVISGNYAVMNNARGAGIFHDGGTVILGAVTNGTVKGNTITNNHVYNTLTEFSDVIPYNPANLKDSQLQNYIGSLAALFHPTTGRLRPAGAAIHIERGDMGIYRNIIAANRGNYAIYGTPTVIIFNNIYDNYIVAPEREDDEWVQLYINQNWYFTSAAPFSPFNPYPHAIRNFWGTRSDLGMIDPSIHDDNEDNTKANVIYQPLLAGPHDDTPGIVDNIDKVLVLGNPPSGKSDPLLFGPGITSLPTDDWLYVIIRAQDNNGYSADFTEVRIANQDTGLYIQPLLWEMDLNEEIYIARFKLSTGGPQDYDPANNVLPVTGGATIRITSIKNPSVFINLMAAEAGATSIYPYLRNYDFGPWVQETYVWPHFNPNTDAITTALHSPANPYMPTMRFTFTNGDPDPNSTTEFEVINIRIATSVANTESIPGGGFDQLWYRGKQYTIADHTTMFHEMSFVDHDMGVTTPDLQPYPTLRDGTSRGTLVPPGGSFDVLIAFDPGTTPGLYAARLVVTVSVDGDTLTSSRAINLFGETSTLPITDPFGSPIVLTNQMTFVSHATKVDLTGNVVDAVIGDVVAAYVIKSMNEELRGKAVVQNNLGLVTVVANTDIVDEVIYFKVFCNTSKRVMETIHTSNAYSVLNGTVGLNSRSGGHPIDARLPVILSGYVTDDKVSESPIEGAKLVNIHPFAMVNNATSRPFGYVVDKEGYYFIQVYSHTPLMLQPQLPGWTFTATTATPVGTATSPSMTIPNAESFLVSAGLSASTEYVIAHSLYYNHEFSTATNHGLEILGQGHSINYDESLGFVLNEDHSVLHFTGTIETFVIAGILNINGDTNSPIAGVELTVRSTDANGNVLPVRNVFTDMHGQFYFRMDMNTTINSIEITPEALAIAGYSHIHDDANATANIELKAPAPITWPHKVIANVLNINLIAPTDLNRTQTLILNHGWNLVSLNVDPGTGQNHPSQIFGAYINTLQMEIRTGDGRVLFWETAAVATLTAITPGMGLYINVGAPTPTPAVVQITGRPTRVAPIRLDDNNWNLIGYTPAKQSQSRVMVRNDEHISQVNNVSQAYFYEDDPIGATTMRFMEPSTGYWMKVGDTEGPVGGNYFLDYGFPAYNNVIKSFNFTSALTNEAMAVGVINNDYSGFPMLSDPIDTESLNIGQAYKIVDLGTSQDWSAVGAHGRLGEVFIATDTDTANGGRVLPVDGPKHIDIVFAPGQDASSPVVVIEAIKDPILDSAGLPTGMDHDIFTPIWGKWFDESAMSTALGEFTTTSTPGGWTGFLDHIGTAPAPQVLTGSTFNWTGVTLPTGTNSYLILSDVNLANTTDREFANIVTYRILATQATSTVNDNLITFVSVTGEDADDDVEYTFYGVQTGEREFTIALPIGFAFNTTPANLNFAITGSGLFDVATAGTRLVSGAPTVTADLSMAYWVEDTTPVTPVRHLWTINWVRLPNGTFRLSDYPLPAPAPPRSMFAQNSVDFGDPFGVPRYLPNSHHILTSILNNGLPVTNDFVLAAYVNDVLRGKTRIVNFQGRSYAPILVSTLNPDDVITFELWGPWHTVGGANRTFVTIPGGRTGTMNNPFELTFSVLSDVEEMDTPFINELLPAFPNPFNPNTNIRFSLKADQHVSISVYNVKGQRVTTLVNDVMERGNHQITWHGNNAIGRQVSSGIYFIRMQTDDYTHVQKAVMMK